MSSYNVSKLFLLYLLLCDAQMMEVHLNRDKAIKACIAQTSEVVEKMREQRAQDSENLGLIKQLRKEQTKVSSCGNYSNQVSI